VLRGSLPVRESQRARREPRPAPGARVWRDLLSFSDCRPAAS
jgi:hypothetical protein